MPVINFQSDDLGVNLNFDFENPPSKRDIYSALSTQVTRKNMLSLIDNDKTKAMPIDAYRNGFFDDPDNDISLGDGYDIVKKMFKSTWDGLGKIVVDRPVVQNRTINLAKKLGGIEVSYSSFKTGRGLEIQDIATGGYDSETNHKLNMATSRVLESASVLDAERVAWDDGEDQVIQALAYYNLDPNDKNLKAEVGRRAYRFSQAEDSASFYQAITNTYGDYAMLGSAVKTELQQGWFKDEAEWTDDEILSELKHRQVTETINKKFYTMGATNLAGLLNDKFVEDKLRKRLIKPDEDVSLALEVMNPLEGGVMSMASKSTQLGVRGITTPGKLTRLNQEYLKQQKIVQRARGELDKALGSVKGKLPPIVTRKLEETLNEATINLQKTERKINNLITKSGGPTMTQKGIGKAVELSGAGIDKLGRLGEFMRRLPGELAVDLVMKFGAKTPEEARRFLGGVLGVGAGGGAIIGYQEDWTPSASQLLTTAGVLLGPRALQTMGTTLIHAGRHWMKGQGTQNLYDYISQLSTSPKLSSTLVDRTTNTGFINTLKESSSIFTREQGIPDKVRSFARGMAKERVGGMSAGDVASFVGRTGKSLAVGSAIPGSVGYITGGEEGMYSSIGAGGPFLAFGVTSGEIVRSGTLAGLRVKQGADIKNYQENLEGEQLNLYNKLDRETQAGVATASLKYPDLKIKFIDDANAGNGKYELNTNTAIVNLQADKPLVGVLAHEVGHHIIRHGLQPMVHDIYFGSVAKQQPGIYTALDDDGNPIIEYENGLPQYKVDDAKFDQVRNQYLERLERTGGVDEGLRSAYANNKALIIEEIFAEHVANDLLGNKPLGILQADVGDLAKSLFSAISGNGFRRQAGVGMGLATDELGNGIFSIGENKQLTKLIKDFQRESKISSRDEMESKIDDDPYADIELNPSDVRGNKQVEGLFNGRYERDSNGNIVRDISGNAKLMSNYKMDKQQRVASTTLSDLIDGVDQAGPGHVVMRESADGRMMGEGLFLSGEVIDKMAETGQLNPSQINYLRQASQIGRRILDAEDGIIDPDTGEAVDPGNEILMFYYPATKGGRKYKSLRGGYRSMLYYGMKISKDGNINLETLSLTGLEKNISKMLRNKKTYEKLQKLFGGVGESDLRANIRKAFNQMLRNHHNGFSNDDGKNGISTEQKHYLNAMTGENALRQGELNPVFGQLRFRPESTIRSRRIDRIGQIQTTGPGNFVDYYKLREVQMPRMKDAPGQQTMDFDAPAKVESNKFSPKKIAEFLLARYGANDGGDLEGLALQHHDKYDLAPSSLEQALRNVFFDRQGFRNRMMPRMRLDKDVGNFIKSMEGSGHNFQTHFLIPPGTLIMDGRVLVEMDRDYHGNLRLGSIRALEKGAGVPAIRAILRHAKKNELAVVGHAEAFGNEGTEQTPRLDDDRLREFYRKLGGVVSEDEIGSEVVFFPEFKKTKPISIKVIPSNDRMLPRTPYKDMSQEFKDWFGNSVVRVADGKPGNGGFIYPKIVFHGTPTTGFSEFSYDNIGNNGFQFGPGFYFTDSERVASGYTDLTSSHSKAPGIYPVYLKMENPLVLDTQEGMFDLDPFLDIGQEGAFELIKSTPGIEDPDGPISNWIDIQDMELTDEMLMDVASNYVETPTSIFVDFYNGENVDIYLNKLAEITGHDGVIVDGDTQNIFIPWNNRQIKSATGNQGSFDPGSADIRMMPAELRPVDMIAREPGWADSPKMQEFLKHKGDPYFKLPQQKGQEQVYPEVFFHDGSIGLRDSREDFPANWEFRESNSVGIMTPIFMSTTRKFTESYGYQNLKDAKNKIFTDSSDDKLIPVEGYDNFGPIQLITNVAKPFDFRNRNSIIDFVEKISNMQISSEMQNKLAFDNDYTSKNFLNHHAHSNLRGGGLDEFFGMRPGSRRKKLLEMITGRGEIVPFSDDIGITDTSDIIYNHLQGSTYRSQAEKKLKQDIAKSISNFKSKEPQESNWTAIEGIVPLIKIAGFDSFTTMEAGTLNIGVFDSKNVKLLESVKQGGKLVHHFMGQDNTFRRMEEMLSREGEVSGNYNPDNRNILMMPRTEGFKNWFKKSKVVHDDGTPRVVYHGSPWAKFSVFDGSFRGNWFSEDIDYAKIYMNKDLGRVKGELEAGQTLEDLDMSKEDYDALVQDMGMFEVYLSMQNPLDITNINLSDEITLGELRKKTGLLKNIKYNPNNKNSRPEFLYKDDVETYGWEHLEVHFNELEQELRDKGYDGLIAYETGRFEKSKTYMPLDATQIKSATDNQGTFDPGNPDIRMMPRETQELITRLQQQLFTTQGIESNTPGGLTGDEQVSYLQSKVKLMNLDMKKSDTLPRIVQDKRKEERKKHRANIKMLEQTSAERMAFRDARMMPRTNTIPGFNVRNEPGTEFADLIVDGKKTIETRRGRTLDSIVGSPAKVIRTGQGRAMVIGEVVLDEPKVYLTKKEFDQDKSKHLVKDSSEFAFGDIKYGYPISSFKRYDKPYLAPVNKGIVTTKEVGGVRYMPKATQHPEALPVTPKLDKNGKQVMKPKKDSNGEVIEGKYEPVYESIDYDLANSPLVQAHANDPDNGRKFDPSEVNVPNLKGKGLQKIREIVRTDLIDDASNQMVKDYKLWMQDPEISAGQGWYSRMRVELRNALGQDTDFFCQLLGATSANTPVEENFNQAVEAYELFNQGKYNRIVSKYKEAWDAFEKGGDEIFKLAHKRGVIKLKDYKLKDGPTPAQSSWTTSDAKRKDVIKEWVKHYNLMPLRRGGAKYNANTGQVMRVLAGSWSKLTTAPKTPNFTGNLTGATLEATIDVWAGRYLRRLLYKGQKQWRIQPASEKGVSDVDFALGQLIFRATADKLGINPDDLQAIAWFGEKGVWDTQGWTGDAGAYKSSFDEPFNIYFPKGRQRRTSQIGRNIVKYKQKERLVQRGKDMVASPGRFGKTPDEAKDYLKERKSDLKKQKKARGVGFFLKSGK